MENNTVTTEKKKNKKAPIIVGAIVLIVGFFIIKKVMYSLSHEDTENSQIETNIAPVASRVQGFVMEVLVKENQAVKKGDVLVQIDDRDLKLKVAQAEINLANAQANLEVIKANLTAAQANENVGGANVQAAKANIESAKVKLWKAQQDYNRYENLLKVNAVTQQQFDAVKAEKEGAEKQIEFLQKQLNATSNQSSAINSQSQSTSKQIKLAELAIDQRKAELDMAQLNLSFTKVIAPYDGVVAKKTVQLGQLINVGQTLLSVVDQSDLWVNANFKETQITNLKIGQEVDLHADAYKGKTFVGTIQSIAPASGSKFSLIPADNATGNFVKVVQRIPVRISIKNDDAEHPLKAGMNVVVEVKTK